MEKLYCNGWLNCIAIEVGWLGKNCIAILVLYCDLKASRDEVPGSQYTAVYCD